MEDQILHLLPRESRRPRAAPCTWHSEASAPVRRALYTSLENFQLNWRRSSFLPWSSAWVRSAKWNKLGNVWLLYCWFLQQPRPKISCTKTQTLPNLFLFASLEHEVLDVLDGFILSPQIGAQPLLVNLGEAQFHLHLVDAPGERLYLPVQLVEVRQRVRSYQSVHRCYCFLCSAYRTNVCMYISASNLW